MLHKKNNNLFLALRGAGSSYGVVTLFRFQHPSVTKIFTKKKDLTAVFKLCIRLNMSQVHGVQGTRGEARNPPCLGRYLKGPRRTQGCRTGPQGFGWSGFPGPDLVRFLLCRVSWGTWPASLSNGESPWLKKITVLCLRDLQITALPSASNMPRISGKINSPPRYTGHQRKIEFEDFLQIAFSANNAYLERSGENP